MSQRIEGSGSGSLAGSDLMSIVKGALIAGLAAAIPTIIDYLGGLQIVDPKSAAIVAVVAIALNVVRKWLTNTRQQVARYALLAAVCGLALSALPARAAAEDGSQSGVRSQESGMRNVEVETRKWEVGPSAFRVSRSALLQPAVFRRQVHVERERSARRWPIARGVARGTAAVGRGLFRGARFVLPPYGGRR